MPPEESVRFYEMRQEYAIKRREFNKELELFFETYKRQKP